MSSTMELEVADLERICREAATYATQHNEARLLLEKQLGKTRSELTESERRRNLETQRLAAQVGLAMGGGDSFRKSQTDRGE